MERFQRFIPPYFLEKALMVDEKQLAALPDNLHHALIHGTKEEFRKALEDIHTRERLQRTVLLGEAAMELIRDMRSIIEGDTTQV